MIPNLVELRRAARDIFESALQNVDACKAIQNVVSFDHPTLRIFDHQFDTTGRGIYVLAIGKAAHPMAEGLAAVLGDTVRGGLIVGPPSHKVSSNVWHVFTGGHPIPNAESLAAAKAAFALMRRADAERAIVIFLISGGGSAMIESPRDDHITLDDLRQSNYALVSSEATIKEINSVRQAFSAIKGGGLASCAPRATQVNLIVSDVNSGEEENVASGPTVYSVFDRLEPRQVIDRYRLRKSLPESVIETIDGFSPPITAPTLQQTNFVLLDNRSALEAAVEKAQSLGFNVEVAGDIVEQPVDLGCKLLLSRLDDLRKQTSAQPACLISGGEFRCPVQGNGQGGRNLETVLRCAINLKGITNDELTVVLSCGTDGIDGNSPAAGAIADQNTIERGRMASLNAASFLAKSDSYSFFNQLGDAIIIGPTGTNVRDLRILLGTAGNTK